MGLELDYIFHPRSIAIAGASESPEKFGHTYFKNVLENFSGKVYPINVRATEILGVPTYKSIRDLPENVDYVVSAIPNRDALDLVDACVSKGVKTLHLYTARFSETGSEEGAQMERDMLLRARAGGMRILGPNCMGLYYPKEGLAWGRDFPNEHGNVGIISQSGGNAGEIISVGASRGLRFSKVISYGNALDLNEADLVEYLADDPETEIIGGYIEGVRDGPRFVRALRYASSRKPVVFLKGGRTQAGTNMVSSHTGALAGAQEVWQAICRQMGVINVFSMEELLDALVALTRMPKATGANLLVGGGTGGKGVMSADECEEEGLHLLPIPGDVREELIEKDPFFGAWVTNPVDGSIMGGSKLTPHEVITLIAKNANYDVVINGISPSVSTNGSTPAAPTRAARMLEHTADLANNRDKPVALVIGDFTPESQRLLEATVDLRRQCVKDGFAVFPTISRAARAIKRLVDYYRWREEID
ncbi:MAG: CoA-binding protein [Chloroflexi bacterium]|nr:CoA-binding protein [Chloroflexota bacterium]